jgi:predicted 3-demethylubiquinone-9 3-methyltransferase (glyoxalase superfamily)
VEDQKELDYYWEKLTTGGDAKAQMCGWLKDKYGLSWQIVPRKMVEWFGDPNEKSERAMSSLMAMRKLDIAALERAYSGQ